MMDGLSPAQREQAEALVGTFAMLMASAPDGQARATRDIFLAELDALASPAARAVAQHIRTAPARRAARLARP